MTEEDRKPDEDEVGAVAASERISGSDDPPTEVAGVAEPSVPAQAGEAAAGATGEDLTDVASAREAEAQAGRAEAEADLAENREQVAHAESRRLEEAEGEAEKAREEAVKTEQAAERKQAEAREREERVRVEARRAREQAEAAARQAREARDKAPIGPATISAATVTSPGIGIGMDPEAAAAASYHATAAEAVSPTDAADDPFAGLPFGDRPEIQVGIAFASTFLLAKVLKILGR